MSRAEEVWDHIERLLTEECGLMADQGLVGQRPNCVNAIKNALGDDALLTAAASFLREGNLYRIRVNGTMMTREQIADLLMPRAATDTTSKDAGT